MAKFQADYPLPAVTVDMVVFTLSRAGSLDFLAIRRREAPCKGMLALPGGFVNVGGGYVARKNQGESLEAAAARELREETNLGFTDELFLEQLYTFGAPGRDPRGRVVSVAYYALISGDLATRSRAGDDAATLEWTPLWEKSSAGDLETRVEALSLAFDHKEILLKAIERLRGKIDYDPRIARGLLPSQFTMGDLRHVHETVKGATYDRSNFAKRFHRMVEDHKIVEAKGRAQPSGPGRPSKLYRFPEAT